MAKRHFPVRPNLEHLKHQAKDLLREYREGSPEAAGDFSQWHPHRAEFPERSAQLADAQLVLARSYGIVSWQRLVHACQMTRAIQENDLETVQQLIVKHPQLLHEDARGVDGNWGPPMSYAANLGRDNIIAYLADQGARDIQHAFDRACLQGQLKTAEWLLEHGATLERGLVMGPCETLNGRGLEFLLSQGAELCDEHGNELAPIAMVLETYTRNPEGKHRCLELMLRQGVDLPDTPVMAFHSGSLELLTKHLQRDPQLLERRFTYRDIYPLELGCHSDDFGLHGTPLDGVTLLHLAVDFDEMEIAHWLVDHGADVNAVAEIDADGFGGHTPLFNAAVCQAIVCGRQRDGAMGKFLLEHGADPMARATLRKRLRFVDDESMHSYRDVTPWEYAEQFHEPRWTCPQVTDILRDAIRLNR